MYIAEEDGWTEEGNNILLDEKLEKIRLTLEEAPVILEHRFYRCARSPDRLVFDVYEELVSYLKLNAQPGDAFYLWNYAAVCRDENILAS
ncbi:MAG TPA: hypothetical protein VER76_02365, partial [Pyrinomonadaceae bacterium]|nr:hypothetical protein [Pyrinomonadaceae bacterium]